MEVISQFNQEREEEYKIDERHLPELGTYMSYRNYLTIHCT